MCGLSCRDRNDLAEVVALLKTQIDPELLKKEQENKPDGEDKKKAEGKGSAGNHWSTKNVVIYFCQPACFTTSAAQKVSLAPEQSNVICYFSASDLFLLPTVRTNIKVNC